MGRWLEGADERQTAKKYAVLCESCSILSMEQADTEWLGFEQARINEKMAGQNWSGKSGICGGGWYDTRETTRVNVGGCYHEG